MNPGGSEDIRDYFKLSMIDDPWKFLRRREENEREISNVDENEYEDEDEKIPPDEENLADDRIPPDAEIPLDDEILADDRIPPDKEIPLDDFEDDAELKKNDWKAGGNELILTLPFIKYYYFFAFVKNKIFRTSKKSSKIFFITQTFYSEIYYRYMESEANFCSIGER